MKNIDLNLLKVFDVVMTERNVSKAAETLFLSQPAVSHALTRLRHSIGDKLFVKVPSGVAPTARAVELAQPIRQAIAMLESALSPERFEPSTSERTFRIAAHDYFTSVIAAPLAKALAERAPNMSVRVRPTAGRALEQLDRQEVDFAVSAFGEIPNRFASHVLIEDRYVCVLSAQHPLAHKNLTMQDYCAARHLLVSPKGDERGFVDTALAKLGRTRHIGMIINQFSPAGSVVENTDLIFTAPQRIAERFLSSCQVVTTTCPVVAPDTFTTTHLVWHNDFAGSSAHQWFIDTLVAVTR
ncbi:LysR substrate-binding domain-containing protein [Alteromonas oceanisediminis]|uniref:LysR substrate-binding domain-containing protein n=1 Tax=Alteromonas oceanisediminis TaxID=2836180 RepID=UPI001BDA52A6|nr:LysR substrate-binding domain-containing protein [Alteromonas oceanisediminis]MBT0587486.1 LysR family transcriptional regulator [Alteromonas oceanisediminis]